MTKKYAVPEKMVKEIKGLLYESNPKCNLENEKKIREEIKKQYVLKNSHRISDYTLYYRILNNLYEKRINEKNNYAKIAGKIDYEFKRNSTLNLSKNKAMKFIIEKTNAAQPKFMSLATNMPMESHIALLTKLPQPEIEEITPSDVDRRNWGI